ncbi:hypothetical protein CO731_04931 [Aminobacter sp. MSH1]|uniref:hypothetical protein n=1 Tax=Aminobacter sp. MSH1 TaxID=374606 RepID=UPI000D3CAB11|nr:hypothetical protein [Aminobacter sp. MSH1]AWC25434.1 hypothetical protein CO731_04931 [Aminobacter sp. MSH1]
MTVFAIIAPEENEALTRKVEEHFPSHLEFSPGQFVASSTTGLTAGQAAELLGAEGQLGRFVVFTVAGHWGYHRKDLWEWLRANPS